MTPGFTISSGNEHCPVLLSIPHAGRDYPADIAACLTVPLHRVRALEDTFADRLADVVRAEGGAVLIARTPRLIVDLNRAETDFDPQDFPGSRAFAPISVKARGGLGVVPTRLTGVGELWRHPIGASELSQRLSDHHRPYHAALAAALASIWARMGGVVLIDLHSMPSLAGPAAGQVVIGTRNGATAPRNLIAAVQNVVGRHGLRCALETPYAGGHIITRHARPHDGVFALQIEVDRQLYLDPQLNGPGAGLAATAQLIADLVDAASDWITTAQLSVAAE